MSHGTLLPPIPAKRYFTIGEVAQLCGVKPHVLRYWEQEFSHLRPVKRRGNRRYYQRHELLMIRRIRELLYEQGFTIQGARARLREAGGLEGAEVVDVDAFELVGADWSGEAPGDGATPMLDASAVRHELLQIRELLSFSGI